MKDYGKLILYGLLDDLHVALKGLLLGKCIPVKFIDIQTGETIIPANRKITMTLLRKLVSLYDRIDLNDAHLRKQIYDIIHPVRNCLDNLKYADNTNVESAKKLLSSLPEEEIQASVKQLCRMLALGENKKLRAEKEYNMKETDLEKLLEKLDKKGVLRQMIELEAIAHGQPTKKQTNNPSSQKKPRHD